MTYLVDGWDLYVCKLLNEVREYKVNIEGKKTLIEKSHYVETVLFVSDTPDKAYEWAINAAQNNFDQDHDGTFDLRQMETIGIIDVDNLQINLSQIESSIKQDYGCTVDNVNINSFELENIKKIPEKSSLSLFKSTT